MNTNEFVQATILKATGKVSNLISTDAKWTRIVDIGNRQIRKWERLADWNSLYEPKYNAGTVTATDRIELDDEVRKLSDTIDDNVRIVYGVNQFTEWQIVDAEKLKLHSSGNYCAKIGRNLVFNKTFSASDVEFGGTIEVPVYYFAETLTGASSDVPVDDPEWLVCMTAAEYVRTDITKQNQYPNLVGEANSILSQMLNDNDGHILEVYRPWSAGI